MSSGQREDRSSHDSQRFDNDRDWDSSRGYGSDLDRDYDRGEHAPPHERHRHASRRAPFRYSNDYGGPRNANSYRNYPTHRSGRSEWNKEDDDMKQRYDSQQEDERRQGSREDEERRLFGGRDYERYYPTRAERDPDRHAHDFSEGWQSNDSYRGYRSLNNTGRTGIGQDNRLGRDRDTNPNTRDQNYSRGDYRVNLGSGGQDYDSRHYYDRDRPGTRINEYAQQGYSKGYGQTGYSEDQAGGDYANPEVESGTRSPKNYRGSDERIYVEACEALGREIDASDIEVNCSEGEVTLTGTVKTRKEKRLAEHIVDRIMGVQDIHNQLKVADGSTARSQTNDSVNGSGKSAKK